MTEFEDRPAMDPHAEEMEPGTETSPEQPREADPADVTEQSRVVELDEEP